MKYFFAILKLSFLIFFGGIIGCSSSPENHDDTKEMVEILKELNSKIDPLEFNFLNATRAKDFEEKLNSTDNLLEKMKLGFLYANELIRNNENEKAIRELEQIFSLLEQNQKFQADQESLLNLKKKLALAYMRLGEANNCIDNSNRESCLMPIKGEGVYKLKSSVEAAIQIYEEILSQQETDYESVWMLNFAYMALGEYPEGVPEKWRISPTFFESQSQLTEFPNISKDIGLNTVGLSGGVAIEDFNNDGLLDVMASSYGIEDQIRLFMNDGSGKFMDKTDQANLTGLVGGLNIQHADFNNDGWVDVLILRGAWFREDGKMPNSLLKNNGDGTFSDVTISAGLLSYYPTQTAVWQDFDRDGNLDLLIGNEAQNGANYPLELFMNNGDGTFSNRTNDSGLGSLSYYVKGITAGDINNDGLSDVYISVYKAGNVLLLNQGIRGKGLVSFKDISANAGVRHPYFSFPTWFWDYNNDGLLDIFSACYGDDKTKTRNAAELAAGNAFGVESGGTPVLLKNNGNLTFTDKSKEVGFSNAVFAMGSNFGDIDNDGFLDCYLGTGAPELTAIVPNKMYRNNQGLKFEDVTTAGNFGHIQKGHAVGFGDFDNDGDQDVFCVLGGAYEGDIFEDAFFLNPIGNAKSWITLKLEGMRSNKSAIGAKVKVVTVNSESVEQTIYRWVNTGGSFGGNSLQLEIGLNEAVKIKFLEITWPTRINARQVFSDIEINQVIKIKEGENQIEIIESKGIEFSF